MAKEQIERISHVRIDIESIQKIRSKGMQLNRSSAMCIFQVPKCLKDLKREVYTPQVVGLGPFHHGTGNLPYQDELKTEAVLRNLIKIYPSTSPPQALEKLRREVMEMKREIQECYETFFSFNPDIFILDSCFVVEFLFPYSQDLDYPSTYNWNSFSGAAVMSMKRDLLKLENQMPLILIKKLLHLQRRHYDNGADDKIIARMVHRLYYPLMRDRKQSGEEALKALSKTEKKPRHLLELAQQMFVSSISGAALQDKEEDEMVQDKCGPRWYKKAKPETNEEMWSFPRAYDLVKFGIKLKCGDTLSFDQKLCGFKGVLTIPALNIVDSTELWIKNMIAFEEILPSQEGLMSGFMAFLDCLIDKESDVEVLRKAKIIDNYIESDQAVADLVNSCCVNVSCCNPLRGLKKRMMVYYRSSWRVMVKEFMDTYVLKPWYLIGTLVTIALLVLTIMQTIYAIKSFEVSKHPSPP